MTRLTFLTQLSQWLHRQWLMRGWLSLVMQPFSWIVLIILALRRKFFLFFPDKVYRAPVPVVVIGNIYVGGTGKTPVVIGLVQALMQKGWRPGVISRGYGVAIGAAPCVGRGALAAVRFGDEPALIAHQTGAPVAVHPDRKKAIEALLAYAPQTDLIVSDDGLQHLALARDLEIIVQDQRIVGNGYVMPAGPLRETIDRLEHVQAIVTNVARFDTSVNTHKQRTDAGNPSDPLSPQSQSVPEPGPKTTEMALEISRIRNLVTGQSLTIAQFGSLVSGHPLAAAAGIGTPERFFQSLRGQGFTLNETLALPDHHTFTAGTLAKLSARHILITEKDAVKCNHLQDARLWVVEVAAVFSDPGFTHWLSHKLAHTLTKH